MKNSSFLWQTFCKTGDINDYMKFKSVENFRIVENKEEENATYYGRGSN